MSSDLISRAAAGDEQAFRQLVDPYRRELHVHCYRILGSTEDAEDALQETLLAAWQGLGRFERRASIRTWLYRVATNRCLNTLRSASRRPRMEMPLEPDLPEPTRLSEVVWLEPYPDVLLEGLAGDPPGPEARFEAREAISLAFVTALQLLPPRQGAVLILRDVLGYRATEVAQALDATTESVTSAVKRARATLARRMPPSDDREPPPPPHSAAERELVERLTRAFEASDVAAIVALLSEDVQFAMPPLEYHGRELAARFLTVVTLQQRRRNRVVATRATANPLWDCMYAIPAAASSTRWGCWCSRSPATRSAPSHASTTACSRASGCPERCPADDGESRQGSHRLGISWQPSWPPFCGKRASRFRHRTVAGPNDTPCTDPASEPVSARSSS